VQVKVVVHEAEEGGFWAEVPALPGCVSQGETMDELLANVREAIQAWLATEPPVESGCNVAWMKLAAIDLDDGGA
jgi:predicted RNase H-like HicB family nuclease